MYVHVGQAWSIVSVCLWFISEDSFATLSEGNNDGAWEPEHMCERVI